MEHLIVIIDNNKKVEPRLYSCKVEAKTKQEAINSAKRTYEKNTNNFDYTDYYFSR